MEGVLVLEGAHTREDIRSNSTMARPQPSRLEGPLQVAILLVFVVDSVALMFGPVVLSTPSSRGLRCLTRGVSGENGWPSIVVRTNKP